jgi:uncharacterized membrane protein YphA (DoxX/SURF4 family)
LLLRNSLSNSIAQGKKNYGREVSRIAEYQLLSGHHARRTQMDIVFLVGRIILGGYYLFNALNHFNAFGQTSGLAGWAGSKGVPSPKALVYVGGVLLAVAGLSFLTGYMPLVGVIALAVFLVPVTFKMHDFWTETDGLAKWNQIHQFIKNVGLLASALMFLAIPQPWPLSLGQ